MSENHLLSLFEGLEIIFSASSYGKEKIRTSLICDVDD